MKKTLLAAAIAGVASTAAYPTRHAARGANPADRDGNLASRRHKRACPPRTDFAAWQAALRTALARIASFHADALVVSLGVDTFAQDPISFFKLESADFSAFGRMIGALRLPTLFVFEGGYNIEALGEITVNVLEGFVGR